MSKHNNANPDHYKVAGRERPGDDIHQDEDRQQFSGSRADVAADAAPHIPNQERASQPRTGGNDEKTSGTGSDPSADPQNINGTDEVEPTLSDDEGHTG